jgi:ketosteroid isomerase-like protein
MQTKLILFLVTAFLISCNSNETANHTHDEKTDHTDRHDMPMADKGYGFGDDKYIDIAKNGMNELASGDVEGWLDGFSDDALFRWNGGDSLAGKPAIADYWKKRRTEVIESLSYSNEVWLPIHVTKPSIPAQLPGNYALCWSMVHARYKSGKEMNQRMHMVFHFNDNDKIDRVTQYIDRVPINNAQIK